MNYYFRVFLWENGCKSTEFTEFLTFPIFLEDKLDEELDSGEIVLENMPISSRSSFKPKTKIRLERYITQNFSDNPKTWDMIVERDDVEEYVGAPDICCHRISLIEVSAIAQGMHTDNFSLTYELQDVDMNYRTIMTESETLQENNLLSINNVGYAYPIHNNPPMKLGTVHFINSFRYKWENTTSLGQIIYRHDARTSTYISFTIPTLMCQGVMQIGGQFENLFEVQTTTQVVRRHYRGTTLLSEDIIQTIECGPQVFNEDIKNDVYNIGYGMYIGSKPTNRSAYLTRINPFTSSDTGLIVSLNNLDTFSDHLDYGVYATVEISKANINVQSKFVELNTSTLSEEQLENGERYEYLIVCKASKTSLPIYYDCACEVFEVSGPAGYRNHVKDRGTVEYTTGDSIKVSATFYVEDLANDYNGGPFIKKGVKYSAFDLIRKALLTCDTRIIDNNIIGLDERFDENNNKLPCIEYPIIIDPKWENRLKLTKINETIFEQKNLWEIFLQVGYYLHAIPYMYFASDGTDRFELSFKQLGSCELKYSDSSKITIFNSQSIDEYFSQYDSYVTNLFSPQNEVEEWVVPKASDGSYLTRNDNATLILKYPITEIVDFDVVYKNGKPISIIDYIFEESIYSVITNYYTDEYKNRVTPSKGAALFYTLGDNKIQGLNYVPPSVSEGTEMMSLKNIMEIVLKKRGMENLKFSELMFHIKYKTQDTMRLSQVRPNLQDFIKNSSYDNYPHHEQFYGQEDKIIDSERFSANLFGKLIKVGNAICQTQEYATNISEKESGDLIKINNELYYVTKVENEFYADAIYQKITYSKNFNQMSMVVNIPSEPRFYEVSERSKVRREIRLMEFFKLGNFKDVKNSGKPRFLNDSLWRDFIKSLLFNDNTIKFPNFAFTTFAADKLRDHNGVLPNKMFPSCETERTSDNSIRPVSPSDHVNCIVPLLHYPIRNGIAFEWDMDDNFKCGDFADVTLTQDFDAVDNSYIGMQPLRYCDVYGRADLFSFKLFNKENWTFSQSQSLPKAIYEPNISELLVHSPSNLFIGLDKDCREEISFNYIINLLYDVENGNLVTFPNLFGEKTSRLHCCLLRDKVSLFDENANIKSTTIVADDITYYLLDDENKNAIEIRFNLDKTIDISEVKSIVFYDVDLDGNRISYLAKNVDELSNSEKLQSLGICPIFNN